MTQVNWIALSVTVHFETFFQLAGFPTIVSSPHTGEHHHVYIHSPLYPPLA